MVRLVCSHPSSISIGYLLHSGIVVRQVLGDSFYGSYGMDLSKARRGGGAGGRANPCAKVGSLGPTLQDHGWAL